MAEKFNLPKKGGYLHTHDGDTYWRRNEDGPIGIKPKFKAWPDLELRGKGKTGKTEVKGKVKSETSVKSAPSSNTKGTK